MKTLEPEYIVDASGRKIKVVLPVEEYERLVANPQEEQARRRKGEGALRLDWRGALAELRSEYDSVGLQHDASRWRDD
jgi:hypothetical protein